VRTFTLKYWAASLALSHSLAGVDRLLIGFPYSIRALSDGENDKTKQQEASDYDQDSHDGDFHFAPSPHKATPSQPRSGQRKPFTVPSNMLVLISLGVIQNLCPQSGHVSR